MVCLELINQDKSKTGEYRDNFIIILDARALAPTDNKIKCTQQNQGEDSTFAIGLN